LRTSAKTVTKALREYPFYELRIFGDLGVSIKYIEAKNLKSAIEHVKNTEFNKGKCVAKIQSKSVAIVPGSIGMFNKTVEIFQVDKSDVDMRVCTSTIFGIEEESKDINNLAYI